MESLNHLKNLGTDYFKNNLFKEEEVVVKYSHNYLAIGKTVDEKIFYLDLKQPVRMMFVAFTGAGKTFLMRGMMDRLSTTKRANVILTDIKDEFKYSIFPCQKKFHKLLLENEKPTGLNIAPFRPTYFQTFDDKLPKNNQWFSINIQDMTRADFMTLLDVESMNAVQQAVMEIIFQKFKERIESNPDNFDLSEFDEIIDDIEDMKKSTASSLKMRFAGLYNSKFYDKNFQRNVVKFIKHDWIPTYNLEGFENFGRKGGFKFTESLLNMELQKIINARRKNKIKPIFIWIDEGARFLAKGINSSFKFAVQESFEVDRRYNVNYAVATQDIDSMEDRMIKQCRYLFIGGSCDASTIRACLMSTGLTRNQQIAFNDSIRWKKKLRANKHSWLVIDTLVGRLDIVIPLAPLSKHAEAGMSD